MKKIIVANWKSNPSEEKQAVELAKASDYKHFVICPPLIFLSAVGSVLKQANLGSQNVFWKEDGPYTGEVSINQLKKKKVKYVIVGHSERRRHLNELDDLINKKIKACFKYKLIPILCVGEKDKKAGLKGLKFARNFVSRQLTAALLSVSFQSDNQLMVAYEPVWSIGGNQADEPSRSAVIMAYLRDFLRSKFGFKRAKLLYGGSVNSQNIGQFLTYDSIDGALVGSASLSISEIRKIAQAVELF